MTQNKDLKPRPPVSAPAVFEVTQAGEHNTNIAHIEHAHMPVVIVPMQASPNTPSGQAIQFDLSCYHLFVIAGEDFLTGRFFVDPTRALTEYTSDELKARYQRLNSEAIEELKRFPALFMAENAQIGRALPEQEAHWGNLVDIRVQDNGIRIAFNKIMHVPQQRLNEYHHHFGITSHGRMSELNRTHWALKRVNLLEAFTDTETTYLPFTGSQGGVWG